MARSKADIKQRVTKPKAGKRLTAAEWGEAEALWASGEFTLKQLAERFGIRGDTLSRHFSKHDVKKGSKSVAEAVRDAVTDAGKTDGEELMAKIRSTKDEHYRWSRTLGKLAMAELAAAKQNGQPVAVATPNLKSIKEAMVVIKMSREERWAILGLDQDQSLDEGVPELIVRGLTQDEIGQLHMTGGEDELTNYLDESGEPEAPENAEP